MDGRGRGIGIRGPGYGLWASKAAACLICSQRVLYELCAFFNIAVHAQKLDILFRI